MAGVCAGIARYFGIDPVITRIAAVGLVFLGGIGIALYLAAWLLVPDETDPATAPGARTGPSRVAVIGGIVLACIAFGILADRVFWWPGAVLGPFAMLALIAAAVWWLVRGRGDRLGGAAARLVMAVAVLVLSAAAIGAGFWAAGLGGGAAVAGLLVASGVGIMVSAFAGGARWLIAPAIALALGAGVATAADVDLRGDYGDRYEVPRSADELPAGYDVGMGSLKVDLRDLRFPEGERRLTVEVGVGEAVIAVPADLCVVIDGRVGVGELRGLGREQHGIDLTRRDTATPEATRLVVDAEVGLGSLRITTTDPASERRWEDDFEVDGDDPAMARRASAACAVTGG